MKHPSLPALLALVSLSTSPALLAAPDYNQVSLRAEVSTDVARDRMHVTLYTEGQDKDPARLSANITRQLNTALEDARQASGVSVSLGNRSSYPLYEKDSQQVTSWRERAELRLESADFATLARLTAQLSQQLKLANLAFSVSDKARQKTEEGLIKEAITAFKARAHLITQALGGKDYRLINLNLGTQSHDPMPVGRPMAMMMKAERAPAPIADIESGTQPVSVTADGLIEVQF